VVLEKLFKAQFDSDVKNFSQRLATLEKELSNSMADQLVVQVDDVRVRVDDIRVQVTDVRQDQGS
jgi:hypothetical protein